MFALLARLLIHSPCSHALGPLMTPGFLIPLIITSSEFVWLIMNENHMLNICSGKLHAHIISVAITCTKHHIFHELPTEYRLMQVIVFLSDVLVMLNVHSACLSVCVSVCMCECVWSLFLPWQELSIWARWALQINSSLWGTLTLCRHHWMGLSCLLICMKGKKK